MNPEEQINRLNLKLPPVPRAGGIYHPVVIAGKLLFVSGQAPCREDGTFITGKVGKDLTVDEAKEAACQTGLTMLATLKHEIGSLNKIKRLIKTFGMVNCTLDFSKHPAVINGFCELMVEVFGEEYGKGVRSAVGMILPGQVAVEIEAIFELY